jgi:hypothetical protein
MSSEVPVGREPFALLVIFMISWVRWTGGFMLPRRPLRSFEAPVYGLELYALVPVCREPFLLPRRRSYARLWSAWPGALRSLGGPLRPS